MNEVKVYKPLRNTAVWASWTKDWQEAWVESGMDPDHLILDRVITPKELSERVDETLNKIKKTKDRQFSAWRNMANRPKVKCLNCGKVTENLADNGQKEFCSNSCGVNYRYQINKIESEGKSEEARQSGQSQV